MTEAIKFWFAKIVVEVGVVGGILVLMLVLAAIISLLDKRTIR